MCVCVHRGVGVGGGGGVRGWVVGVGIFHKRNDIILPIRLPQDRADASSSSFYICRFSHRLCGFLFWADEGGTLLRLFYCASLITAQQLGYLNVHLQRHYT